MDSAERQANQLARRIERILDPSMRGAYVRHTLQNLGAANVADVFVVTMSRAEARDPRHGVLLQAMSLALADAAGEELRRAVCAVLDAREHTLYARILMRPEEALESEEAQRVPDFGKGRPVTLGERKSLARRNDRELITRVLRDPHPDVIRILLGNPGLTENDMVLLCARRPVAVAVLREVFKCPRWIVRYHVKLALVLNPYTPLDIALQLLPHIKEQDRRRLITSGETAAVLRDAFTGAHGDDAVH